MSRNSIQFIDPVGNQRDTTKRDGLTILDCPPFLHKTSLCSGIKWIDVELAINYSSVCPLLCLALGRTNNKHLTNSPWTCLAIDDPLLILFYFIVCFIVCTFYLIVASLGCFIQVNFCLSSEIRRGGLTLWEQETRQFIIGCSYGTRFEAIRGDKMWYFYGENRWWHRIICWNPTKLYFILKVPQVHAVHL